MTEEWRDIEGYNGKYAISNLGRVRSNNDYRVIKQWVNNVCGGYCYVRLYNTTGFKNYRVHRLVAQAFIPNPNNLPEINHKDENKENNRVDNLEWITHKDNIHYGNCISKISNSLKGRKLSDEQKQHIREHSAKPFLGKHHTDETKHKLSILQSGENNNGAIRILVYNDSESYEFNTIKQACIDMGVPQRNLYYYIDTNILYRGYYWKRLGKLHKRG